MNKKLEAILIRRKADITKRLREIWFPELIILEDRYKKAITECERAAALINESRQKIESNDKGYIINGPAVFLGSFKDSNIEIKPELNPRIVLSELRLDSLLSLNSMPGSVISGCNLTNNEVAYTEDEALQKIAETKKKMAESFKNDC